MPRDPHPLATLEQVVETPSAADGVPEELESDLRVAGCMMLQEAGVLLKLPQSTMATAQVIFHRFWYVSSMLSFSVSDLSVSSLYLATKLNETPVRLRDLINTYIFLQARIQHLLSLPKDHPLASGSITAGPFSLPKLGGQLAGASQEDDIWQGFRFEVPSFHSTVFWDSIQYNELQILKRLGFNMQVDLPYSHVINYLKILDLVFEEGVAQQCWSILNDALLTPLYVLYPTHVLAVASILLCTRLMRIALPDEWWLLFDAELADATACAGTVVALWAQWGLRPVSDKVDARGESRRPEVQSGQMGDNPAPGELQRANEARWRRAWVLIESRKAVRRWVEERGRVSR